MEISLKITKYFSLAKWKQIMTKQRILKWLGTFLFVMSMGYVNIIVNIHIQNIMIDLIKENKGYALPLKDLGFDIFPYVIPSSVVPNFMLCFIIFTILNTLLWKGVSGVMKITQRFMLMYGVALILRTISVRVTILPNPDPTCIPVYYPNVFIGSLLYLIGKVETCFDCLFSGHTSVIVFCTCMCFRYTGSWEDKTFVFKFLLLPFTVGIHLVISTRFHYTVDVYFAILISIIIFDFYHGKLDRVKELIKMDKEPEKWSVEKAWYEFIIKFESWENKVSGGGEIRYQGRKLENLDPDIQFDQI